MSILEEADDLLVLAHAEAEELQPTLGMPSWVPDRSVEKTLGLGVTGYKRYAAAGNLPRSINLRREERVIELKATKLDEIVEVGETKGEVEKTGNCMRWLSMISELNASYHTGQSRLEVFWRTLITDTAGTHPTHPISENLGPAFKKWLLLKAAIGVRDRSPEMESTLEQFNVLANDNHNDIIPATHEVISLAEAPDVEHVKHEAVHYDVAYGHALLLRLFRAAHGFLGQGSQSLRCGDTVRIVPVSHVPLIMRSTTYQRQFRLVGATYLHDFKHGEALRAKSPRFEDIELE